MSNVIIQGREYWLVVGSDLDRDGMFLECSDANDGTKVFIEVFYSDADGSFTVDMFGHALPLALVKLVVATAERELPPRPVSD